MVGACTVQYVIDFLTHADIRIGDRLDSCKGHQQLIAFAALSRINRTAKLLPIPPAVTKFEYFPPTIVIGILGPCFYGSPIDIGENVVVELTTTDIGYSKLFPLPEIFVVEEAAV